MLKTAKNRVSVSIQALICHGLIALTVFHQGSALYPVVAKKGTCIPGAPMGLHLMTGINTSNKTASGVKNPSEWIRRITDTG